MLTDLANEHRESSRISKRERFIGGMFSLVRGSWEKIGLRKRGKGMNIMGIVGRRGLPCAVSAHAANNYEVKLVQLCFDFYVVEAAKPENLIGDLAHDRDEFDEELPEEVMEMIAPHRKDRKRSPQDGGRLWRCEERWLLERFFGWLQWSRYLTVRWECYATNFLRLPRLGYIGILLKRF